MITYPVSTKRIFYSGSDVVERSEANTFNAISLDIENHVNGKLKVQAEPIYVYMYCLIARDTGYTEDQVRDACLQVECGSGGFVAIRSGISYQEAIRWPTSQKAAK